MSASMSRFKLRTRLGMDFALGELIARCRRVPSDLVKSSASVSPANDVMMLSRLYSCPSSSRAMRGLARTVSMLTTSLSLSSLTTKLGGATGGKAAPCSPAGFSRSEPVPSAGLFSAALRLPVSRRTPPPMITPPPKPAAAESMYSLMASRENRSLRAPCRSIPV